MAGATRSVKQLLLFLAISAVFRPIPAAQRSQPIREDLRTGFRPPDSAGHSSDVQEVRIPVWLLLLHYGSMQVAESRVEFRRRRECGMLMQRAVRHLLYLSKIPTARYPVCFLLGCVKSKITITANFFLGTGAYFAIILLSMGDIETNPGPADAPVTVDILSRLLDEKLGAQDKKLDEKLKVTNNAIGEVKNAVENFATQLVEMSAKIDTLTAEKEALADRVIQLEKRIEAQEGERRRNNVVIFGVKTKENLDTAISEILYKRLGVKCETVQSFFRIGKPDGLARPVIVQFRDLGHKMSAMKSAYKLKGTTIAITDDLSPAERAKRRELVSARRTAVKLNLKVKVMRDHLQISGEKVTLEDIREVGWLRKFQQQQGDNAGSESAAGPSGSSGGPAAAKKRGRQAAMLSPENPPLEPQAELSQGFATAPLTKKKAISQTKAVSKSQGGRKPRSLERVATRSAPTQSRASSLED